MGASPIEVSREEVYQLIEFLLYAEERSEAESLLATTVEIRELIEKLEHRLID